MELSDRIFPVSAFNNEAYTSASMNHFKIEARKFDISCSDNNRVDGEWTRSVNTTVRSIWKKLTGTPQFGLLQDGQL